MVWLTPFRRSPQHLTAPLVTEQEANTPTAIEVVA
jgi:hypothetical protein